MSIVAVGFISFAPFTAQAQWPHTTNADANYFSVDVGARIFDRPGDDLGLGLVFDGVTNEALFTSDQATDLDTAAGVDIRVNFKGPRFGNKWEFRSILADFEQTTALTGTDFNVPLLPVGTEPETFGYNYESRLLSFELNHKRAVGAGLVWLNGFRFISVDETASLGFQDQLTTLGGPFTVVGGSTVEAINSIYGLQTGFEFNMPVSQQLYISTYGKFGGYHNPTKVISTTFNNVNPASPFVTEQSKSTGTFVAEIGGRLNVEIIPRSLTTYVGYDAMWIDGIALAPPQFLSANTLGAVDTTNTPFFQSISLGAQLSY